MGKAKYLVTGAAGFVGMHLAQALLARGLKVVGIDNLNDYYPVELKRYRLNQLEKHNNFRFIKLDIAHREAMAELFATEKFTHVVHLAAQAGVRYSLENPYAYVDSNLLGTMAILEGCRHNPVHHLIYASSSSVYGMNGSIPFRETDQVDQPVSLYAATKKANELMAYSYSKLYKVPATGLRFFTVYGPAGRPDMAPWLFTEAILKGEPIKLFNNGEMQRDFTYIDDIVEGIVRLLDLPPVHGVPHDIFNIGNNQPIELGRFIAAIEAATGMTAKKRLLPMQPGDVKITYANTQKLETKVGYKPQTTIEDGIAAFVEWFKEYNSQLQ
jgi:UDP-glucuronate 4-epimerase